MPTKKLAMTIDDYIASFAPDIQVILRRIRQTVKAAAPDAEETISYRMPTFNMNGPLIHFAAFKTHIGLFPPVRGNAGLMRAVKRYAGPKGNLKLPIDEPIPYALIRHIVMARVRAMSKTEAKRSSRALDNRRVQSARRPRAAGRKKIHGTESKG
jgi:uncharacterized protein YdhG (YjbR/CyaY superfamily)